MKKLSDYSFQNKNILIRVDLNVPVVEGKITEKSRIKIIKNTLQILLKQKNKIFLLSHFGRPKGKRNAKYSLKFICKTLEEEFNLNKIIFLDNLKTEEIQNTIKILKPGEICLFENVRFYPEEEKNDLKFAKDLSKNFDIFINDAFSSSHRNHASIVGIPKYLPSFPGDSLINEINKIDSFINNPKKPNMAIIGGSKISTKIDLLNNLLESFNIIVIGGAMANTFLYAKGFNVGKSICEKNLFKNAISILKKAKTHNCKIILPIDVVCADSLTDKKNIRQCDIEDIFANQMVLDVGIKTTELISKFILKSKMILWNGPLGAFEYKPFEKSSVDVANIIKNNSKLLNILTLAGGGDTISALRLAKADMGFSYISNAGGAFLEWLEGKKSPGIIALEENYKS